MNRMFRVLGFWTGIFAVMFYLGDMKDASLLFFGQTVLFVFLSYLNLTERMYIYIFWRLLNNFLCRIYILLDLYHGSRRRRALTCKKRQTKTVCLFFIMKSHLKTDFGPAPSAHLFPVRGRLIPMCVLGA